jgi:hypothetical protein
MVGATVGRLAGVLAKVARLRSGLALLTVGLFAPLTAFAGVQQAPLASLTWAQIYAMTPANLAAVQNPLVAVADPIAQVGSSAMRDIYTTTALDTPSHAVDLYVTNPSLAGLLLQVAKRFDPGLDLSRVRVRQATYTSAALTAAGHRLLSAGTEGLLPFPIYAANQDDFGSSLTLQVPDPAVARQLSGVPLAGLDGRTVQQLARVRLTFEAGTPMVSTSRENDVAPYIGGDFLTSHGENCTAGIPVENANGRDFLVTAAHCFPVNAVVTTRNGHRVGVVTRRSDISDSELVDTGLSGGRGSNADEAESDGCGGICFKPLAGLSNPSRNQLVCQDGMSVFSAGLGVRCNIKVISESSYTTCSGFTPRHCYTVDGFHTVSTNGQTIVIPGDSGAVIFTVRTSSTRNAEGLVSASNDRLHMAFTTWSGTNGTNGIFQQLGVHLNPHR